MTEQNATELTATTQKALDWIDKQRERIINCDARCRIVEQAIEQFECCKVARVVTSIVEVHLDCNIESLQELVPVFRFLGQHGYHQRGEPFDHSAGRSYDLSRSGHYSDRITISVMVGEHSRCKPVQVGEETRPIYRMQCDDGSEESERVVSEGVRQAEAAANTERTE